LVALEKAGLAITAIRGGIDVFKALFAIYQIFISGAFYILRGEPI
jgi:hypothetical protein